MKKNLLFMVGLVVFFVGFNGCRPCDKNAFIPGKDYIDKDLDPNTKGNRISQADAASAMDDYYDNYFIANPGSANIRFADYFPEYEVFSIAELLNFVISHRPNAAPAYMVVRHGVFQIPDPNNPTGPPISTIKSILYMTDTNHIPIRSSGANSEILFFEEWRRCPPDTNCRSEENVRDILFPVDPNTGDNEEEEDDKEE